MSLDCIAVLLGRKGSKGLPGKNTMEILGRPISHYSIIAAQNSKYVSDIYVTTDDKKIMTEAQNFDLEIIERPDYLSSDAALFEDALIHGYQEAVKRRGNKPDLVIILMCNVITIDTALIDTAIEALRDDPNADSAVTVSTLNMYSPLRARRQDENGYLLPFVPFEAFGDPATLNCDRDSQGDVYFADMSVSVVRSKCLENLNDGLLPQKWMGRKIAPILSWGGCDVDYEWQLPMVKFWLKKNGYKKF